MTCTICKMTESDRQPILSFMREFYASDAVSTNGSEEIFNADFNACIGSSPYLEGYVMKDGDEYLGYAMIAKSFSTEFGKACIWIEDLYTLPLHRGKGVGSQFLKYMMETYPDVLFRLEAEKENTGALALYKRNGFTELPYDELIRNK